VIETDSLLHAANRELYSEYQRRNLQRRLKLRPCLIQIKPTTQYWGQWNPKTRHIVIAQNLITDYEWHDVVGVLCHEMAHQFADEALKSKDSPHGELFQKACSRVGVPYFYTKAQVHLHQHSLDWRQTQPSSEEEKRLEKIRKLLNLASSSNENEASVAMNRVREIYARYNLEKVASESNEFYHAYIKTNRKRLHTYEQKIMGILVSHYMVEVIVGSAFCPEQRSHLRTIELIGRKENVLMAEFVYEFLKTYVSYKVTEKRKQQGAFPASLAKSYLLGLLTGFDEKLTQQTELKENIDIKNSLVAFTKDPQIKGYISKIHPRLVSVASQARLKSHDFFNTGRREGQSLTINRPLQNQPNQKITGLLK
jgi:predicted SprT family Zn-dependent metalloprotease